MEYGKVQRAGYPSVIQDNGTTLTKDSIISNNFVGVLVRGNTLSTLDLRLMKNLSVMDINIVVNAKLKYRTLRYSEKVNGKEYKVGYLKILSTQRFVGIIDHTYSILSKVFDIGEPSKVELLVMISSTAYGLNANESGSPDRRSDYLFS